MTAADYRAWLATDGGRVRRQLGLEPAYEESLADPRFAEATEREIEARDRARQREYGRSLTDGEKASLRFALECQARPFWVTPGVIGLQEIRDRLGWAIQVDARRWPGPAPAPGMTGADDGPFIVRGSDGHYSGGDAETRARAEAAEAERRSGDLEWARHTGGVAGPS